MPSGSAAFDALGPWWSVFVASFIGPYLFPAAGELAIVAAIGLTGDVAAVLAFGIAGAVASDQAAFVAGRVGGSRIADRMLVPERRAQLAARVHRHAAVALVPGRMLPGARTWIAVLAGVAHLRYRRFSLLNLAGCVIWAVVFAVVGVVFGATADVEGIVEVIRRWEWPIFFGVLALILGRMAWIRRLRARS